MRNMNRQICIHQINIYYVMLLWEAAKRKCSCSPKLLEFWMKGFEELAYAPWEDLSTKFIGVTSGGYEKFWENLLFSKLNLSSCTRRCVHRFRFKTNCSIWIVIRICPKMTGLLKIIFLLPILLKKIIPLAPVRLIEIISLLPVRLREIVPLLPIVLRTIKALIKILLWRKWEALLIYIWENWCLQII